MPFNPFKETTPPPSTLSDADLVDGIRGGKRKLLNELYERYASKIYYKCLGMVKDTEQARDMAHDVFIKVTTNLDKYKGTSELSFWIYAITYNHCIAYLKKAKRLKFAPIDESVDSADEGENKLTETIVRDLHLTQLSRLIKQLKPEEEIILMMRYEEQMNIKQIATILELGESAVKMRLKRVRNRLAELFNELDHE